MCGRTGRLKAGPAPADTPTRVLACKADHTTTTQGLGVKLRARYAPFANGLSIVPKGTVHNICKNRAKHEIDVTA